MSKLHGLPVSRRAALGLIGATVLAPATAQDLAARKLVVGVESSLSVSGLAPKLASALARDTGLAIDWRPGPSGLLLPQLERGELDAAFTIAPELEASLLRQNLVHDRRAIAQTALVLVGPAPRKATKKEPAQPDPAGVAGLADIAQALAQLAAAGQRGEAIYIAPTEPSGVRYLEQALWKAAGPRALGPWLRGSAEGPAAVLALAAEARAYALVERGVWAALGPKHPGLAVLVEGDPRQEATCHLMRSFRVTHPAGKLAVAWLGGPRGKRVVVAFGRGYKSV